MAAAVSTCGSPGLDTVPGTAECPLLSPVFLKQREVLLKSCHGLSPKKSSQQRNGKHQRERRGLSPSLSSVDLAHRASRGLDGSQVWPSVRGRRCLKGGPNRPRQFTVPERTPGGPASSEVAAKGTRGHIWKPYQGRRTGHLETWPSRGLRSKQRQEASLTVPARPNSTCRPGDLWTQQNTSHSSDFSVRCP